ncbi:MAG: M48 family metalloprotease [Gemmatimonadaceae bacterium]
MARGARRSFVALLASLPLLACDVSQEEEVEIGRQSVRQLDAELPLLRDPVVDAFVQSLGDSIATTTSRRDLRWRFVVVDSREVNAFALPGGFIYVNRGLIERADDLSELAGVLGHEIGHVVRRHSVEQMKKARNANAGVAVVCALVDICSSVAGRVAIDVGGQAVFATFSREAEAEADSEAVVNVINAGIDPDGVPSFFDEMLAARRREPGVMDSWFGTHPLEESRVAATRALIARIEQEHPEILRDLVKDTQQYQALRQRVLSLPPPPPPRARRVR